MGRIMQNPVALGIIVIALLFTLLNTLIIVPETRQGVVVRFGEPVRIINRYQSGVPFGKTGAGLLWKIPFIEQVVWIDKRIRDVEMEQQQVLSTDQLRLQVDAFARFRITDPLRMFIAAGSEERVSEELRPILGSALRNELGKRPFAALLSPERGEVMDNIQAGLNRVAANMARKSSMCGLSAPTYPMARHSKAPISGCGPRVIRKREPFAPRGPSRPRSSAPRPMPAPRVPMPKALAKMPTSMISTAP